MCVFCKLVESSATQVAGGHRGKPPDAAQGKVQRRKGVRSVDVFNYEFTALRVAMKVAISRYGGRRFESRLRNPFTGMAQVRLWFVGSSETKSKDVGSEAGSAQAFNESLSPNGIGRGCLRATNETSEVGGFRGEGSPSGNHARRVSVTSVERRAFNESSGF